MNEVGLTSEDSRFLRRFACVIYLSVLELEDTGTAEVDSTGGKQQTLPAG